jgi:glucose-6-phosphate dehydrogenase assembly protein OpcA
VSEDVWAAQDTNPDAIEAALRELLRRRHAENEALVPARVLNLIVIADRDWKGEVSNRLERVGRYQASRTVLCTVEERRRTLDAVATVAFEEPGAGTLGIIREHVEIDLGPEHLSGLQTIVDPVLVTGLPTMLWSPHGHDEGVRALLPLLDVVLIDSDDLPDPSDAFARAEELREYAYVVDLAWLRTTPWRERLAASFDLGRRRDALHAMTDLEIRQQETSTACGLLLTGWLASRLGWSVERLADGHGRLHGVATRDGGQVQVRLEPLSRGDQDAPGLGGVTVACEGGLSLSLQRGRGGLDATETEAGTRRQWKILGASRGEGGILGEGVRQALLRDQTYVPALDLAQELCPA